MTARDGLLWFCVFLAFPIGGLLARQVAGPVNAVAPAVVAGLVVGATLGLGQWLVFKDLLALTPVWIVATAIGMSCGLAASVAWLGSETDGSALLWRGLVTGAAIGLAQAAVLYGHPRLAASAPLVWLLVVAVGWPLGWFVTRSIGVDLGPKWANFGSVGAWAFQLSTGLALGMLIRP